MALDNAEVLKNLQEQLTQVQQQVATGQFFRNCIKTSRCN